MQPRISIAVQAEENKSYGNKMIYEEYFERIYGRLLHVFPLLESRVPQPQLVKMRGGECYRYIEKQLDQAIIAKTARLISALRSAILLNAAGLTLDVGTMKRVIDEIDADIMFLAGPLMGMEKTNRHDDFIREFFQEEFDHEEPLKSSQKRARVPRDKIRAYNARSYSASNMNESDAIRMMELIEKAYSGFVHGASVHIMEIYGGHPDSERFFVEGVLGTSRQKSSETDLANYFERALHAVILAAKALNADDVFEDLYESSHKVRL
ncbi:MAG: hypothetical protein VYD57_01205 [Pseudomonadota bacterium]|nr:hypothetical protein [Pseudomonadota bacterium]